MAAEADGAALSRDAAGDRRVALGFVLLLTLTWASHSLTVYNGLASPLFMLACLWTALAMNGDLAFDRSALFLGGTLVAWISIVDASTAEFLPAAAKDSHWILVVLVSIATCRLLTGSNGALAAIQVAASGCIWTTLALLSMSRHEVSGMFGVPVFGHVRHLGLSIGFMTAILFVPHDAWRGWKRIVLHLTRIAGFGLVAWSGTRGAMIALVLAAIPAMLLASRCRSGLLIDVIAGLVLSMLLGPREQMMGVADAMSRSVAFGSIDQASSFRLSMWKSTLDALSGLDALWTGFGGNGFLRMQLTGAATIQPPGHIQPHNAVVQIISDWGLVGLTLVAATTSRIAYLNRHLKNGPGKGIGLAGIAYILASSQFDATLYHLEHLLYFAISIGIATSCRTGGSDAGTVNVSVVKIRLVIAALAFLHLANIGYRTEAGWYFPTDCRIAALVDLCRVTGIIVR
jgi:hypothetical protein